MKKFILLLFIGLLSHTLVAQKVVFHQKIKFDGAFIFKDDRESLSVPSKNGEFYLYMLDNQNIYSLKFNQNYQLSDSLLVSRPASKYGDLLGYDKGDDFNTLYFTNNRKNKFYFTKIDLTNHTKKEGSVDLKLKQQKFLQTFSYNGYFYILSVVNNSSILKLYELKEGKLIREGKFDFTPYRFAASEFWKLSSALKDPLQAGVISLVKVVKDTPIPIDLAAKPNKIYLFNGKIWLTLDNDVENTKLITLDLQSMNGKVQYHYSDRFSTNVMQSIKSNSFIMDNILYQLKGNKEEFHITAFDLKADSTLNTYVVKGEDDPFLNNVELTQEGGLTSFNQGSSKELDNVKKALKKMFARDVGISVYKHAKTIEVTVGGYAERPKTTASFSPVGMGETFSAGGSSMNAYYNPVDYYFSASNNERTIFFNTLFSQTGFHHLEVNAKVNTEKEMWQFKRDHTTAFDIMFTYQKNKKRDMLMKTVFRHGDRFVMGYYNKSFHSYNLVEFKD